MIITQCVLTGRELNNENIVEQFPDNYISYEYAPVGKVNIGFPTYLSFLNNRNLKYPILAGLCRNAHLKNEEPPIITQMFIDTELKNHSYPKSFKEKAIHFLKVIYDLGGNDYKEFSIVNMNDYTLCYSEDENEFRRILEYLEEKNFIKYQSEEMSFELTIYRKLQLTEYGIDEVEKDLPNIPMIGLVNQNITTGNSEVDDKINYSKELFFREPQTMDRMRSACETLCFILEPLRTELKKHLKEKDIEDFFNIVNNFDIRHNKSHTKEIQHPEQLEWIFYSLLNTINTYTKLKARNG